MLHILNTKYAKPLMHSYKMCMIYGQDTTCDVEKLTKITTLRFVVRRGCPLALVCSISRIVVLPMGYCMASVVCAGADADRLNNHYSR